MTDVLTMSLLFVSSNFVGLESKMRAGLENSNLKMSAIQEFLTDAQNVRSEAAAEKCVQLAGVILGTLAALDEENPEFATIEKSRPSVVGAGAFCAKKMTEIAPNDPLSWLTFASSAYLDLAYLSDEALKSSTKAEIAGAYDKAAALNPHAYAARDIILSRYYSKWSWEKKIAWQRETLLYNHSLSEREQLLGMLRDAHRNEELAEESARYWTLFRSCKSLDMGPPGMNASAGQFAGIAIEWNEKKGNQQEVRRIRRLIGDCDKPHPYENTGRIVFDKMYAKIVQENWRSMPPPYDIHDARFMPSEYSTDLQPQIEGILKKANDETQK